MNYAIAWGKVSQKGLDDPKMCAAAPCVVNASGVHCEAEELEGQRMELHFDRCSPYAARMPHYNGTMAAPTGGSCQIVGAFGVQAKLDCDGDILLCTTQRAREHLYRVELTGKLGGKEANE